MTSTPASAEQFAPVGRGIELCYQTFGSPEDEPLLLIMGLGGPMTWWEPGLCTQLADAGFYVIRFDNRDAGRSSSGTGRITFRTLVRAYAGLPTRAPYSLRDLAADSVGLLDHLGVESAHVWGVSMGGMIAQTLAVDFPDRVRSLVSMMSTTGNRRAGWQHPTLLLPLLRRRKGLDGYILDTIEMSHLVGSPGYPPSDQATRLRAIETYERGLNPEGSARQMLAILTQPDRTAALRKVRVPTTVVHGLADKMVHVSGGRATSMAIPGADLRLIHGMGHDLPEELWPTFVEIVKQTAARARG